ncbi:hypothetical protein [Oceanospirillum sediminis]|uniref:Uncharacterized protein n=1 Tax=Oceanospirillum sediminis TaxID=2760088 RepID=A0A839ISV3_9GAMM|nr:hypothetical protein [Oceanospirillum sediminis]MBB1487744.1 hypothetical protein [Oceanospirillum sediminis]
MSDNQTISPELELQIRQMIDTGIADLKAELVAYIDEKYVGIPDDEEEATEPLTLNMVMLQITAIFEKFSHYDEIYRTFGIEADTFQDECNENIDGMRFRLEHFEGQLRDFQNRLLIEESGGDSAIMVNRELKSQFEQLAKEVQETINQFDQYFQSELEHLAELPAEMATLKEQLDKRQTKAEALISSQENKQLILGKLRQAVDQLNEQLPKVVAKQIEKKMG